MEFEELYQTLKQEVFVYAYRILQNREDSEDIVHDVFLELLLNGWDSIGNIRAFVMKMTHNRCIDLIRKRNKECFTDDADVLTNVGHSVSVVSEGDLDIETAIAKLPEDMRMILTLHINSGFKFREIADILGFSLPAVYRRYKKAIKALRELL